MGKTNYLRTALLKATLLGISYSSPPMVYLGLFSSPPDDAYTAAVPDGTELAGNGYARTQIVFGAPTGTPPGVSNIGSVFFPVAGPLNWPTATHYGIFDGAGNLLYWSALASPVTVLAGTAMDLYIGNVVITET